MELKTYQKNTLTDLGDYLKLSQLDYIEGYNKFWEKRGYPINPINPKSLPPYQDTVKNCPHVCIKVPTAGGKTFIACNALKTIFDNYPELKEKIVVWLVPGDTILKQTIKNLSDPNHPYHQKISSCFGGRFAVLTKEMLNQGINFNLTSVKDHLNILVLSFASLRAKDKESRKLHQENGNLQSFELDSRFKESPIEGVEQLSVSNILYNLHPVVIVDESHNAESDLSVEMLQNLNPSFILDLTATPKKNSNIISYVSAIELKKENMVKLPVIACNMQDKEEVFSRAIDMQRSLEQIAKENEEQNEGPYIRPIVIFQAQQRIKGKEEDTTNFLNVKDNLLKIGIPENQIAIQTATIKELNNVDLLDRKCQIRYIITINALREGWDCPFAYILASLANKSSEVDVTQILGRVLRQPFTRKYNNELLNMSYVFTASPKFQDTLENIIEGLNQSGFSSRQYRVSNEESIQDNSNSEFVLSQDNFDKNKEKLDTDKLDFSKIKIGDTNNVGNSLTSIQNFAMEQNKTFEDNINNTDINSDFFGVGLADKIEKYAMDGKYRSEVEQINIPQFFMKTKNTIFGEGEKPIEKIDLYSDFKLLEQDSKFNFEDYDNSNMKEVDVVEYNGDYIPKYSKTNPDVRKQIASHINSLSKDQQIKTLIDIVYKKVEGDNSISQQDLKEYIRRVITGLSPDQFDSMKEHSEEYAFKIKKKIDGLKELYAKNILKRGLETEKFYCKGSRKFPLTIGPSKTVDGITKSLYEKEGEINDFEKKVIDRIANCDNVVWWHRNLERKGFFINGQINHYPDFIVKTKRGKILLIETKGDDRDNSDSQTKVELGKLWATYAGNEYKYYMIFENKKIEGADTVDDFLNLLKDL